MMGSTARLWLGACALVLSTSCGFQATASGGSDGGVDAAPPDTPGPSCAGVTCDAHASCAVTGGAATCMCNTGWSGTGLTCADVDECATANGGCAAACENTAGSFVCYAPKTCAEVKAHGRTADGSYALYFGGNAAKSWTAHCVDMATAPKEYLALPNANTAQYKAGNASPGTDVNTRYNEVRLDPMTLMVDVNDRRFATSTGMVNHANSGTMATSMAFGFAMDCKDYLSGDGVAVIDLGGTPFALPGAGALAPGGNMPGSTQTTTGQKVTLHGGGFCGWFGPAVGAVGNGPFNNNAAGKTFPILYP